MLSKTLHLRVCWWGSGKEEMSSYLELSSQDPSQASKGISLIGQPQLGSGQGPD